MIAKKIYYYIYGTVSETNSVYSFSFLRNWGMQSYSVTITCCRMTSLFHNGFSLQKGSNFIADIYKMLFCVNVEFRGLKLQTHFSHHELSISCGIFLQVICLHFIKHVFCINIYQWSLEALKIKQTISIKNTKKLWTKQDAELK